MRLSAVTIRRFKSIQEITVVIPKTDPSRPGSADFVTLVGRNNAGKSSILEAIRLSLPTTDLQKPELEHFPNKTPNNGPIEVELEFDSLTEADMEEQGIRTHVHEGKYRIKKTWTAPDSRPQIWAFEPSFDIPSWPDPDRQREHFERSDEWREEIRLFEEYKGERFRATREMKDELRTFMIQRRSPLVVEGPPTWQQNPGGFSAHVDSVLPQTIFVPAIRETDAEASISQKGSAARQIVHAMFSKYLADHPSIKKFTEAGDAVKELFSSESKNEVVRWLEQQLSNKLRRVIELDAKFDFIPPEIPDLAGKTLLTIVDGQVETFPEHQGHGAQRTLILSLLELLAEMQKAETERETRSRPLLLLIEEPEIYMHPQMARRMRDVLVSIARSGTAQVICTSHSPLFIDLADRHDGICIVRKGEHGTTILQRTSDLFWGPSKDESRKRLRMLLDFDPTVSEVFFASQVCLVEGDTEVAALDAIARHLQRKGILDWNKYSVKRKELAIVNCRGKWTMPSFQVVLKNFDIPYRVIHDTDGEFGGTAERVILEILDDREDLRLLHNPNFEQEMFGQSWSKDKPWKCVSTIENMETLPDGLIRFFEFVLGCSHQELAPD